MQYVDLHCDTMMKCYLEGKALRKNDAHIDLERLKSSGLMAQCMAIFIPSHNIAKKYNVEQTPLDYFDDCLKVYSSELDANSDMVAPVLCMKDFSDNADSGRMSSILTVEDGLIVDGSLERLDELYGLGVRLITLTWNYENCFGFPQSKNADAMKLGLKPFGIEAVRHMNELGIVIDVSHLSEGGFDDVASHSKKPFAASHSSCHALCGASRNITDRQLRILGDCGGVCGINFAPQFIKVDSTYTETDDVVRHIRHAADIAGIEAVAFGSDFDGFAGDLEIGDCSGMPQLISALGKVFSEREIEKICRDNALRLFRENFRE